MIELQCAGACKRWLPTDCYYRDPTCASGYQATCKECRNEERRARRAAKPKRKAPERTTEDHREQVARELAAIAREWKWQSDNRPLRATIRSIA